jgi:hypothetical protein
MTRQANRNRTTPTHATILTRVESARHLGHITLRQGSSLECPSCGATGSIAPDGNGIGDIFTRKCGQP